MSELNQVVTATETAVAKKRGIALGTKLGPRALTNAEPVIERTITEVDGVKTITVKTVAVVGSPTAAGIKAAAFLSATGKVPEKYTDQATLVQRRLLRWRRKSRLLSRRKLLLLRVVNPRCGVVVRGRRCRPAL